VPAVGEGEGDGSVEPAAASVAATGSAGPARQWPSARGDSAEVSNRRRPDNYTKTCQLDDGIKTTVSMTVVLRRVVEIACLSHLVPSQARRGH
jgi:hypothetical protein